MKMYVKLRMKKLHHPPPPPRLDIIKLEDHGTVFVKSSRKAVVSSLKPRPSNGLVSSVTSVSSPSPSDD